MSSESREPRTNRKILSMRLEKLLRTTAIATTAVAAFCTTAHAADITVTATGGTISANDVTGVAATNATSNGVQVINNDAINNPTGSGIIAVSTGTGGVTVTPNGNVTSGGPSTSGGNTHGLVAAGIWAETTTGTISVSGAGNIASSGNGSRVVSTEMTSSATSTDSTTINLTGTLSNTGIGPGGGLYSRGIAAANRNAGSGMISVTAGDITISNAANRNASAIAVHQINTANTGLISIDSKSGTIGVSGLTAADALLGIQATAQGVGGIKIESGAIQITGGTTVIGSNYGGIGILANGRVRGSEIDIDTFGAISGGHVGIRAMTEHGDGHIDVVTGGVITASDKGIDASNGFTLGGGVSNASLTGNVHVTTNAAIGDGTAAGNPNYGIVVRGGNGTLEVDANASISADRTGIYTQIEGTGKVDIDSSGATIIGGSEGILVNIHKGNGQIDIVAGTTTGTSNEAINVNAGTGVKNITTQGTSTGGTYGIRAENASATGKVTVTANGEVIGQSAHGVSVITGPGDIEIKGTGNVGGADRAILAETTSGGVSISGSGKTSSSGANAIRARMYSTDDTSNGIIVARTGDIVVSGSGSTRAVAVYRKSGGSGDISVTTGNITENNGSDSFGIDAYMENQSSTGKTIADSKAGTIAINGTGMSKGIYAVTDGKGAVDIDTGAITTANATGTGVHAVTSFSNSNSSNDAAIEIDTFGAITGGAIGIDAEVRNAKGTAGTVTIKTNAAIGGSTGGRPAVAGIRTSTHDGATKVTLGANVSSAGDGINATARGTGSVTVDGTGDVTGGTNAGDDGIEINTASGDAIVSLTGAISGDPGILMSSSAGGDLSVFGSGDVTGTAEAIKLSTAHGGGSITVDRAGNIRGNSDGIHATISDKGGPAAATIKVKSGYTTSGTTGRGIYVFNAASLTDLDIDGTVMGGTNGIEFEAPSGSEVRVTIGADGRISGNDNAIFGEANGKTSISNWGILTGLVNVSDINSATSLFENRGVWNAVGGASGFAGSFLNSGTLNLQDGRVGDVVTTGDLTLTSGSMLKLDVDSANKSDSLAVKGAVSLGGDLDVNATGLDTDYKRGSDFQYTLITNDGTDAVTGSFAKVSTNFAFLDPTVSTVSGDGNDVALTLHAKSDRPDFKPHAVNGFQTNVAGALDGFNYDSEDGKAVKKAVETLTTQQASNALDQFGGTDHTASALFGHQSSHAFNDVSLARRGARIGTGSGSAVSTYSGSGSTGAANSSEDSGAAPAIGYAEFWGRVFASQSRVESGTAPVMGTDNAGLAVGGEIGDLSSSWVAGISLGYSRSRFTTSSAGSSSDADNYHLGAYGFWGAYKASDVGLGLSGAVGYTHHAYDTRRALVIGGLSRVAEADYGGHTISGEIGLRYGIDATTLMPGVVIAPFVGAVISYNGNDGYSETGAGALNLTASSSSSTRYGSVLGLEVSHRFQMGSLPAHTIFSAGWNHEFGDVSQSITYSFAGSPTPFSSASPGEARDWLEVSGGIELETGIHSSLSLAGAYQKSSTSQQIGGELTFKMQF